jgi:hypothetical protein
MMCAVALLSSLTSLLLSDNDFTGVFPAPELPYTTWYDIGVGFESARLIAAPQCADANMFGGEARAHARTYVKRIHLGYGRLSRQMHVFGARMYVLCDTRCV